LPKNFIIIEIEIIHLILIIQRIAFFYVFTFQLIYNNFLFIVLLCIIIEFLCLIYLKVKLFLIQKKLKYDFYVCQLQFNQLILVKFNFFKYILIFNLYVKNNKIFYYFL